MDWTRYCDFNEQVNMQVDDAMIQHAQVKRMQPICICGHEYIADKQTIDVQYAGVFIDRGSTLIINAWVAINQPGSPPPDESLEGNPSIE